MPATPRLHWLLRLACAALALGGAALLGRAELQRQREAFDTDGRIAHRLLSQRVAQHDAVLDTLAVLQPTGAGRSEQRLPAVYAQILQVLSRAPGEAWPDSSLADAEARSRTQRHAVLASFDAASGRYDLVMASGDGAYALRIDIARTIPWEEWPLTPGDSTTRVTLEWPGQPPHVLQPGRPGDAATGWPLAFSKVLASPSQPFQLVITRSLGWGELPWLAMAGWVALVLLAAGAGTAWQRQATERRRAEGLLRLGQVARLNTLGELAAGLAHELNQPLTAVVANTQAAGRLLREQDGADPTALAAMDQAVAQARRAAEVVGRLRRVVERPATADLQAVVLQDAVRNALHLLEPECRRRQVDPVVRAPAAGLRVAADPVALEQIVHNLLMNALQALEQVPPGRRRLMLNLSENGRQGQLVAADSGPGIPPDAMDRLFQPFFSTREAGLGLGLSLCETLASSLGGSLTARNREGGGAEFTLTLPLETASR